MILSLLSKEEIERTRSLWRLKTLTLIILAYLFIDLTLPLKLSWNIDIDHPQLVTNVGNSSPTKWFCEFVSSNMYSNNEFFLNPLMNEIHFNKLVPLMKDRIWCYMCNCLIIAPQLHKRRHLPKPISTWRWCTHELSQLTCGLCHSLGSMDTDTRYGFNTIHNTEHYIFLKYMIWYFGGYIEFYVYY